jgi:hypothetical protein
MGRAHRSNGIKSAFFIFDKSPDFSCRLNIPFTVVLFRIYFGSVRWPKDSQNNREQTRVERNLHIRKSLGSVPMAIAHGAY